MPWCAVAECKNDENTVGISFHRIPKNKKQRIAWVEACKRKDYFSVDSARICSAHFSNEDFLRDLKSEFGFSSRRRLIDGAIPHLNIPTILSSKQNSDDLQKSEARTARSRKRELNQYLTEILENERPSKKQKLAFDAETISNLQAHETERSLNSETCDTCMKIIDEKNKEIDYLKEKISHLEEELKKVNEGYKYLQKKSSSNYYSFRKISSLYYHHKVEEKKKTEQIIGRFLNGIFTKSQQLALISSKRVKWSLEDIVTALCLRGLSKRSYTFVRNEMKIPLPSLSTLKRWVSEMTFSRGMLKELFHLLSSASKTLTRFEKLCVILIDEISVDGKIDYDHSEDVILGPHKNAQVVMIRGLLAPWKQPIFYDFDCRMTKALLFEIIKEVEKVGFEVVALTSDLGAGNQALWKELNININCTHFQNPFDENRNVYVFADVPHLLKLLRNHLLNSGLILSSGTILDKNILINLLEKNKQELKLCPKLSLKHIQVKGVEKMKVSFAAQVFSHRVSCAIRYFFPSMKEAADFFKLVNDAFDVLNSRFPTDKVILRRGYGFSLQEQNSVLDSLHKEIQTLRVVGKKSMLPFQIGFIVSIISLKNLFHALSKLNISYILTCRLNQDCLESFFSQIRGMGHGYDQPSPSQFKYRLRLLLLSGRLVSPSAYANVAEYEKSNVLTSSYVKGLINIEKENKAFHNVHTEDLFSTTAKTTTEIKITCNTALNVDQYSSIEKDAVEYLAGYLAFKSKDEHLKTNDLHNNCSWMNYVNKGGLSKPSADWLNTVMNFENVFLQVHGHSLKNEPGITRSLLNVLKSNFPDVDEKILSLYSRLRIFIRIKSLNENIISLANERKCKKKNLQFAKSKL